MLTEECAACGATVPLSDAVHMLVNPKEDEDVADGYLCRSCYEEHVQHILPEDEQDLLDDEPDADDHADPPVDDAAGDGAEGADGAGDGADGVDASGDAAEGRDAPADAAENGDGDGAEGADAAEEADAGDDPAPGEA